MELTTEQIYEKLSNKTVGYIKVNLLYILANIEYLLISILEPLLLKRSLGYESSNITTEINPLLWEFGYMMFFQNKYCNKYLFDNYNKEEDKIFNTILVSKTERYNYKFKIDDLIGKFKNNSNLLRDYIEANILTNKTLYFIILTCMNYYKHIESLLYTYQVLEYNKPSFLKLDINKNKLIKQNEFIKINGGNFIQGRNDWDSKLVFDNECPSFQQKINTFYVSKFLITNNDYLQFIQDNGYNNKKYWSINGWEWKEKNNINLPLYWIFKQNEYYTRYFKQYIAINNILNYPIIHISWYEAEAFCNYMGCRLITESEWEYIAIKQFPLSLSKLYEDKLNIGFNHHWITPVGYKTEIEGPIKDLIGNCWEWCSNYLYPYDGYCIDPVYREFSYPDFGKKKVIRGGAWCVPIDLCDIKYRNSQSPECRHQYIGFRVAKK